MTGALYGICLILLVVGLLAVLSPPRPPTGKTGGYTPPWDTGDRDFMGG